jgi:amino acid transporter
MIVVLSSYELVNAAYYILLPWDFISSSNAVAVAAASALFGRAAGILVTILVALSCAGSIASNVFGVGRLTIAASQRHYLPAFLSRRGLPKLGRGRPQTADSVNDEDPASASIYDAPM